MMRRGIMPTIIMRIMGIAAALAVVVCGVSLATAQADLDPDGRPILEAEQLYPTEHFLIHYTLVGTDAVPTADEDQSGTPDYVERVASELEDAYTTQVETWGWAAPPPDAGKGGDDQLDVYLGQLFNLGIAGFVSPTNGWVGDNPNTQAIERNAAYTYMVLDNDFAELSDYDPSYDEDAIERYLEAVIDHEFNHMVQSGYNGFDDSVWLYEGSASWAESRTSPEFALDYVPYTLKNPDYCLPDNNGREQSGLRWYGSWLFFEHLTAEYGRDFMRDLWAAMGSRTGEEALQSTLAAYDTTLEAETFAFGLKNLVRAYQSGPDLPTVRLEGETTVGRFVPVDGVQPAAVDYIRLTTEEELTVSVGLFEQEANLQLSLVTISEGEATYRTGREGVDGLITPEQATYIMVYNAEPWEQGCPFANYGLTIQLIDSPDLTAAQPIAGSNYTPPLVRDEADDPSGILQVDRPFITDPEGQFSERPELLNASFDLIIPEPVANYAFDFASIREGDSFGFLEPYYAPGGGEAAVFDYSDDAQEWLRITQSQVTYAALEDWLDDINYDTQGEIITVGGVDVLLEDLTREGQPWISATIITNGLFIVVDGSSSEEDVLAMVEAVLRSAGVFVVEGGATTPNTQPLPLPFDQPAGATELPAEFQREMRLGIAAVLLGLLLSITIAVGVVVLIIKRIIPNPAEHTP